jgi:hypothetical protein
MKMKWDGFLPNMFKRMVEQKSKKEKTVKDAYLIRLENSVDGFCGMRHSGDGPFLTIYEFKSLLRSELKRLNDMEVK